MPAGVNAVTDFPLWIPRTCCRYRLNLSWDGIIGNGGPLAGELRPQPGQDQRSGDAGKTAGDHGGRQAKGGRHSPGFRVPDPRPGGDRRHLQAHQAAAQLVGRSAYTWNGTATAVSWPPSVDRSWPAKLDACVQAIFDSYTEHHDLHEVLFHHGGHVSASHRPSHVLPLNAIRDILAGGTAAGVFDVGDPAATAVLCWASTHGFDPGFYDQPPPADDARLIRAARQLFRRAAGTAG
jgi:hypothetical protein